MKNNIIIKLKNNTLPCALIVLGLLVFFLTKDYKQVPSGLGPAFFPRIVAFLMIFLSVLCILFPGHTLGEEAQSMGNREAYFKIVITVVSLIVLTVVMKYVHPLLGILAFLFTYLKAIAKISLKKTIIITVAGTVVLYFVILALRIPM